MAPELLQAYHRAMPRLEAEECLAHVATTAAAVGQLRREARASLLSSLRRAAQPSGRRADVERPRDLEAMRRDLAARGIGVRVRRTQAGAG